MNRLGISGRLQCTRSGVAEPSDSARRLHSPDLAYDFAVIRGKMTADGSLLSQFPKDPEE